jgi:hypothetical protein
MLVDESMTAWPSLRLIWPGNPQHHLSRPIHVHNGKTLCTLPLTLLLSFVIPGKSNYTTSTNHWPRCPESLLQSPPQRHICSHHRHMHVYSTRENSLAMIECDGDIPSTAHRPHTANPEEIKQEGRAGFQQEFQG